MCPRFWRITGGAAIAGTQFIFHERFSFSEALSVDVIPIVIRMLVNMYLLFIVSLVGSVFSFLSVENNMLTIYHKIQ